MKQLNWRDYPPGTKVYFNSARDSYSLRTQEGGWVTVQNAKTREVTTLSDTGLVVLPTEGEQK